MAAITVTNNPADIRVEDHTAADSVAIETDEHTDPEAFWGRFGKMFIFTGLAFAIFLFFGSLAVTVAAGGGWVAGMAVGGMAAMWGVPTFGALFAANLASDH